MKAGDVVIAESIITSQQADKYRIKHVITNQYLMQKDKHLVVTDNYLDPATLFSFKPFSKAEGTMLHTGDMAFLRGYKQDWLRLSEKKHDFAHESLDVTHGIGEERDYDTPASRSSEAFRKSNVKDCFSTLFEKLDIPPDSDALLVQPVSVGS